MAILYQVLSVLFMKDFDRHCALHFAKPSGKWMSLQLSLSFAELRSQAFGSSNLKPGLHAVNEMLRVCHCSIIWWPSKPNVQKFELDPVKHCRRAIPSSKAGMPLASSKFKSLYFEFAIVHSHGIFAQCRDESRGSSRARDRHAGPRASQTNGAGSASSAEYVQQQRPGSKVQNLIRLGLRGIEADQTLRIVGNQSK
jgi:hypothetical protein